MNSHDTSSHWRDCCNFGIELIELEYPPFEQSMLINCRKPVPRLIHDAVEGHADCQHDLGIRYFYGEGVPRDFVKARRWLRRAAEQGNAEAQSCLGALIYDGIGGNKDIAEALRLFRLAADGGNHKAQLSLGLRHRDGQDVRKDLVEAYKWFSLAMRKDPDCWFFLDGLIRDLSPRQIQDGKNRIRMWLEDHPNK